MEETKHKIGLVLRAFKDNIVDIDYSIDYILNTYKNSKMFNYNSFILGFFIGAMVMLFVLNFSI